MSKQKRYKGQVSISRWTGGREGTGITITLDDELSGTECVEIHMTVEALGMAITGGSHQDCEFEWRPAHVGKKSEHKSELVPFDFTTDRKNVKAQDAALAPFEVDGWKGYRDDLTNHHKTAGKGKQRVGFTRFVEP